MPEPAKSHCNECGGEKSHEVLYELENLHEDEWGGGAIDLYQFLKCRGCGHYSFRHTAKFFDDSNDEEPSDQDTSYYPTLISRKMPKWLTAINFEIKIPQSIRATLHEVYSALHSDLRRLAAMGIRTLIDLVMTEKLGDVGNFSEKLKAFKGQGFISEQQLRDLRSVIDAGSASAHRGYEPADADMNALMDIVENILASVYVHPVQGVHLTRTTPKRGS